MPAYLRCLSFALVASALFLSPLARAQKPAAAAVAPAPAPSAETPVKPMGPGESSQKLTADAINRMKHNDPDGALSSLTQALKLNPNNTGAYVLRASIYCQKKQWIQAEDDFKAAAKIAPTNVVVKFNLVEIKFMQKQYDLARPGFVALENDPDMGDFASYKVFLCDLFGGHEAAARKDLAVFNDVMGNPSYYFANATWDLVIKKDLNGARDWLMSASRIYAPSKNAYYAQSLHDLGYLPIPGPDDVVTPPSAAAPKTK